MELAAIRYYIIRVMPLVAVTCSNHVISQVILGKFKPDVTRSGYLSKDSLQACPRDDSPHPKRSRKAFMSPKAKAMYAPPDDIDRWAEPPEDGVEDVGVELASGQVGGEGVEVSNLDDQEKPIDVQNAVDSDSNDGDSEDSSSSKSETEVDEETVANVDLRGFRKCSVS